MYPVRILSQKQTEQVLDMKTVIADIEKVYSMKSKETGKLFPLIFHEFNPGVADMDIKSGVLEDAGIFGLKLVSWYGSNAAKGLPLLTGTVVVFDLETGKPLGLLAAEHITGMRTGAAGAIGAKYLSQKGSENLLMVGAGHQAGYQINAALTVLPGIKKVRIFDPVNAGNAEKLAETCLSKYEGKSFFAITDVEAAVTDSDVIVTVTPSKQPLIMKEWVKKGAHFSCVGADMSGKQEIDENIFADAKIFVDDITQATNVGECEIPIKKGVITANSIIGEIGDLICGFKEGRTSDDDITIFDSTGIALQDLMTASRALKAAEEKNIGEVVDL